MFRLVGRLALGAPLVTSGIALAMPSVPVVTPMPAPVRLNHVSMVKLVTLSAGAGAEGDVVVRAVELERVVAGRGRDGQGDRDGVGVERCRRWRGT